MSPLAFTQHIFTFNCCVVWLFGRTTARLAFWLGLSGRVRQGMQAEAKISTIVRVSTSTVPVVFYYKVTLSVCPVVSYSHFNATI